jgi:hypothetical protein
LFDFYKKLLYNIYSKKDKEIKMYICPTCNKSFISQEKLSKHFLQCWKEANPYHQSKPAPRSQDIETIEITDDVANFFNSFK